MTEFAGLYAPDERRVPYDALHALPLPPGTQVRHDREGYHVTLPDGMRLRIVVLATSTEGESA